jgi:hypothetical protein
MVEFIGDQPRVTSLRPIVNRMKRGWRVSRVDWIRLEQMHGFNRLKRRARRSPKATSTVIVTPLV